MSLLLDTDPKRALLELERRITLVEVGYNQLRLSLATVVYAAPLKPREGVFAFADGTTWNPGSGRGLYQYVSGAWVKL